VTQPVLRNWQSVRDEVLRRIHTRKWAPGDLIPNEADLAAEFGCARATVNRALRAVAEAGLLDRRRKAGTRVALQPVAKATLNISVIRQEVEARGARYSHQLISRENAVPAPAISGAMGTDALRPLLHLRALHMADGRPYATEDRWINTASVPQAQNEHFDHISANEWLLQNAAYTHGDIAFSAANATDQEAETLGCTPGDAVFVIDRVTWNETDAVTKVRIVFVPGHQMRTGI